MQRKILNTLLAPEYNTKARARLKKNSNGKLYGFYDRTLYEYPPWKFSTKEKTLSLNIRREKGFLTLYILLIKNTEKKVCNWKSHEKSYNLDITLH